MTFPEIVRLLCYTVAAPSALYVSLYMARCRQWPQAVFFGSLALSWFWYMAEITIASTGINTREYRIVGTPMVMATAVALVVIVHRTRMERHATTDNKQLWDGSNESGH